MPHHKDEQTLVIIKPDGVQRSLIGEILKRFEKVGLKIVGMKIEVLSEERVEEHYTLDPQWRMGNGTKVIQAYKDKGLTPPTEDPMEASGLTLSRLKKYMTSGPVIFIVLQGAHAVPLVRKLVGGTEPLASDVGTIRGDYVLDSYQMADIDDRAVRNLIHASGSAEEANSEIKYWFEKDELINYKLVQEKILYDVNLDGILE